MRCLVFGGAGFIGSHIVDALIARNHTVRIFDLPRINTLNLKRSIDSVEIFSGDFSNVNDISPALDDVDVVIHLVCTTLPGPSNENPAYDVESNVIGTLNLLKQAVAKGVRKIIFSSSGGTVYGIPQSVPIAETHATNPICSYGITKY
jgi:UDP-glucose 4-epimerase